MGSVINKDRFIINNINLLFLVSYLAWLYIIHVFLSELSE